MKISGGCFKLHPNRKSFQKLAQTLFLNALSLFKTAKLADFSIEICTGESY
jgi:hypothetical protein